MADDRRLIALAKAGASKSEAAVKFGSSTKTIQRNALKLGIHLADGGAKAETK